MLRGEEEAFEVCFLDPVSGPSAQRGEYRLYIGTSPFPLSIPNQAMVEEEQELTIASHHTPASISPTILIPGSTPAFLTSTSALPHLSLTSPQNSL